MIDPKDFRKITNPEGYISVAPLPEPEELAKFYSELYYQMPQTATYQETYPAEELAQRRLRGALLMYALERGRGRPAGGASFLEVGAGEGFVLRAAADAGFDVEGIDFSGFGLNKFHPELSAKLRTGDAFDLLDKRLAEGRPTDVCVLQNVLEHVLDPVALLRRIRGVLASDGVAAITVPNDYSRMQQKAAELGMIDGEYWFSPPQHLHYFNVASLRAFVEANGFRVVDAYGDFPIEMFLFHPGANYARTPAAGPDAHKARVALDLLLAENGLDAYYGFCRAMTACGIGRNVTVILKGEQK